MAAGGCGSGDPLAPAGVPCAFSPHSQAYFALASTDGHLRVWETANNRLHQEYVPSAHLSGTCTCLAWAPARLQAKVKRAGQRGAGAFPGSASVLRAGWRVARHRAWLSAARGEKARSAASARTGPKPPAPRAACREGSEGGRSSTRPVACPSLAGWLYAAWAPLLTGSHVRRVPWPPWGGLLLPELAHQSPGF